MDYWYIWYEVFENGRSVGKGQYFRAYKYKSNATRRAKQMWSKDLFDPMTDTWIKRRWIVSQTNPWEDVYIFKTRAEAENLINFVNLMIRRYGLVTRADIMDFTAKTPPSYFDSYYGWVDERLVNLHIQETTCTYIVEFPKALPID